jgi:O-antigen ligase
MELARSMRTALSIEWTRPLAFGIAGVAVATAAASDGGYFPESWAWVAVLTLFPASLVLLGRSRIVVGALEIAFVVLLLTFAGWVAFSAFWSVSVSSTAFEAQRLLAYIGAALLLALVLTRRTTTLVLAGTLAGVATVAGYACLTRLLPDRFTAFDSVAGYRLSDPIGYWNGLGIFSAMGLLLALGFAARVSNPFFRAAVSALPPVLASTLYFTFSRGAWIALAFGLVVAVAVDPRRLRLALTGLVLAPWSILAVVLASRSDALRVIGAPFADATREGHELIRQLLLLAAASGAAGFALALIDRRVAVGTRTRQAFGASLLAGLATALVVLWVNLGSPYSIASDAWDRFRAPPKEGSGDLNERLFDLSSNGRIQHWEVARDDFEDHILTGRGAGTFAFSWAERRPSSVTVQDAHSLYIETLGELGFVGLLLLAGALAVPLVAVRWARRSPILPAALGAYAAYVLHAGVDWDWELTGVTLVALVCGMSLLASARPETDETRSLPFRVAATAVALVLSALAFVSVLGNVPLGRGREALDESHWAEAAAEARAANRWAPWSSEPPRIIGEAELGAGNAAGARRSFQSALERDPENWQLWVDLALASSGRERRRALDRAFELNPLSEQVSDLAGSR